MDIKNEIENIIKKDDVCLFMKGVPNAPQCGFSMAVANILKHLDVKFKGINVLENDFISYYNIYLQKKPHNGF